MEILGLGSASRKSKTFLTGPDMAWIMTKVRAKRRITIEALRHSHAAYHDRPVYRVDEDDLKVEVGREPDILSDEAIVAQYWPARFWDEMHQEFVDHMASHDGFSIKAVSGLEDEERSKPTESSAGAERRTVGEHGNTRW